MNEGQSIPSIEPKLIKIALI